MTADLPADRRLWCTSVHPDDPAVHGGGWHERSECPRCSRKSSHPDDIRTGWCAACGDYTGPGYLGDRDLADVAPTGRPDPWATPFAVEDPPPAAPVVPPVPRPVVAGDTADTGRRPGLRWPWWLGGRE